MSPPKINHGTAVWDLPPLILHPFNERVAPSTLLENSKAALILSGLIPGDGSHPDEVRRRLLAGRHAEVRMLYYLGRDVFRWIEQCTESTARAAELVDSEIHAQSFAALLTGDPPPAVRAKLIGWGVTDYASIFTRAIGIHGAFSNPPAFDWLSEEFLKDYHRYADALYECFRTARPHCALEPGRFRFELYASGEYSRMLEAQWEADGN